MNDRPAVSDQSEEAILSADVSDERLEAAAAKAEMAPLSFSFCTSVYVCPWS